MRHTWEKVKINPKWKPDFTQEFHCKVCECMKMKSRYGNLFFMRNGRMSIDETEISCLNMEEENKKTID